MENCIKDPKDVIDETIQFLISVSTNLKKVPNDYGFKAERLHNDLAHIKPLLFADEDKKLQGLEHNIRKRMDLIMASDGINNATELAELTADELGHDEWLDDECHIVWEVALEFF